MLKNYNPFHPEPKPKKTLGFKAFVSIAVVFLAFLIILFTPFIFHGLKASSYAVASLGEARGLLDSIQANRWSEAALKSNSISINLEKLNYEISRLGPLSRLPKLKNDFIAARQFIGVAQSLMSGYSQTLSIFEEVEKSGVLIDPATLLENKEALGLIGENKDKLALAQKNLDQANARFREINTSEFSGFFSKYLIKAHDQLGQILDSTNIAIPAIGLLTDFLGYENEKHYLLVFENNMELRPTGGFIGSYGIITVKDGKIKDIFTDDVYNLDKLSEGKMTEPAPRPMALYNNQKYWYMRDANWFPSWPDSAQKIVEFFHKERANANLPDQKIDGVIAITPDFIANLLEVLGPIEIHGIKFSSNNFAMDLEKFVEGGFEEKNIPYEERKAIIGFLSQTIIERAEKVKSTDFTKLWLAFKKNIDQKNILVYIFDDKLQKYFSDRNWAGEIRQTEGDYLMVIDSNLASLKTDSVMARSIKRSLSLNQSGDLIARLEITYKHNGQFVRNLITRYRTYAKVYVPEGSWFESGSIKSGNEETKINMSKDLEYGAEYNKSYAAYFLIIEPGMSKTVILNYKLPSALKKQSEAGIYSLLVQKQPGTIGHKLVIDLNLSREISAYQSASWPDYYNKKSIGWQSDLSVDRGYKLKF
ncbi:MAG: DUF4012 domain-containing protein [Candidatus Buchananbacteria bacterium]|nr:DUF4012 domain-containing protein [Candidatus Buchananbacteria bacterium]